MKISAEGREPSLAAAAGCGSIIAALRSYGPSSFASLTDDDGNYLQVGGGDITCMLEWRDARNRRHYRAHLDGGSAIRPDGTVLSFGGGEIKMQSDEWLTAPLVSEAFIAFLNGQPFPPSIKWRDISEIFGAYL